MSSPDSLSVHSSVCFSASCSCRLPSPDPYPNNRIHIIHQLIRLSSRLVGDMSWQCLSRLAGLHGGAASADNNKYTAPLCQLHAWTAWGCGLLLFSRLSSLVCMPDPYAVGKPNENRNSCKLMMLNGYTRASLAPGLAFELFRHHSDNQMSETISQQCLLH